MRTSSFILTCILIGSANADELTQYDKRITDEDRQHWSYQPIKPVPLPKVNQRQWLHNPIDVFILHKLESKNWQPSPRANPQALLRRVYLDITGLPPTLEEQQDFLQDPSPQRWSRLIENLLARPSYGERWGRHWLDVVRYAETNGYERDATKPYVWRYRDYVIQAFNNDKPYDRFIKEQIAGDELATVTTETMIATGFHRLGPWDDEPADFKEDRFDQLNDIVSTTSLVYLGMTMGCARCHNHRFDPVTTHDYYRLVAIFNPLTRPQRGRTELALAAGSPHMVERKRQAFQVMRAMGKLRKVEALTPKGMTLSGITDSVIYAAKAVNPPLPQGYFLQERSNQAPTTHLLIRGKATRPGPKVEPGFPTVLAKTQPKFPTGERTTQRRLTLANWIANTQNPLTARVMVNRVWQYHFGQGIVRSPNDFGILGHRPTHPQLLDWLADWFMRHDWSLKKLHRLIMTSNTYQMSKQDNAKYHATDPENKLLWRFPYQRLEVEAIRDSILAVSGQLNRKMYGPSMYPEVPKEALRGHSDPGKIWKPLHEEEASRRTVYAFIKRSLIVPLLEVLDYCDTTQSTAKRAQTTVAPQALTLFNSGFIQRQSRHFAQRLHREAGDDLNKQIQLAYRLALCRKPTDNERQLLLRFLNDERDLVQMCRVIFNLNEFVYPE